MDSRSIAFRMRRWLLPAALMAAPLLAVGLHEARPVAAAPHATTWTIDAIRYATVPHFPVHDLVTGADTTRTLDIAMMFWLLRAPGHRVLVDAGFYRQKFIDSWKPADYVLPSAAVTRAGVPPESVTDIIISHVHWDHLDGADLFPNARIWIQREEYGYYVRDDGTPAHGAIDSLDAAMLAGLMKTGHVTLVEGDAREMLPGLTAYTGGKHTFASQYREPGEAPPDRPDARRGLEPGGPGSHEDDRVQPAPDRPRPRPGGVPALQRRCPRGRPDRVGRSDDRACPYFAEPPGLFAGPDSIRPRSESIWPAFQPSRAGGTWRSMKRKVARASSFWPEPDWVIASWISAAR